MQERVVEKVLKPVSPFARAKSQTIIHKYDSKVKKFTLIDNVKILDEKDPEAFVIKKKPKLIDEYDINLSIQAEAKGSDLKSQIESLVRAGDDLCSLALERDGKLTDISMFNNDSINPVKDAKDKVPDALKNLTSEQILALLHDIESKVKNESIKKDSSGTDNVQKDAVGDSKPTEENNE